MSLLSSLYNGTSGITANSLELAVVGDNIANANTIGFKSGRAVFEDSLAQNMIGASAIGLGTRLQRIQRLISQGALVNTGMATDLAITGSGLFMLKGAHGGIDGSFYTRAGQFTVDKDGFLVNLEGLRVQGYGADPTGAVTSLLGDLEIGGAATTPRPTEKVILKANLQSDAAIIDPVALPWDPTSPNTTSNFSTSVSVYDSLGTAHQVELCFRRTGPGSWDWHAVSDGGGVAGGTPGVLMELGVGGTLTFDAAGKLTSAAPPNFTFDPAGATPGQVVEVNFGDPTPPGTGLEGLTQFASPSATSFLTQDGFSAGVLANVQIDPTGMVLGTFTNGQTRPLGQVAVAAFTAADQLTRVGANLYLQSHTSGDPNIGTASTGGRGGISAGTLEQSNVDMANEFVRMIAAQRGFQANAKTISTSDQLLGELMMLKR